MASSNKPKIVERDVKEKEYKEADKDIFWEIFFWRNCCSSSFEIGEQELLWFEFWIWLIFVEFYFLYTHGLGIECLWCVDANFFFLFLYYWMTFNFCAFLVMKLNGYKIPNFDFLATKMCDRESHLSFSDQI